MLSGVWTNSQGLWGVCKAVLKAKKHLQFIVLSLLFCQEYQVSAWESRQAGDWKDFVWRLLGRVLRAGHKWELMIWLVYNLVLNNGLIDLIILLLWISYLSAFILCPILIEHIIFFRHSYQSGEITPADMPMGFGCQLAHASEKGTLLSLWKSTTDVQKGEKRTNEALKLLLTTGRFIPFALSKWKMCRGSKSSSNPVCSTK